MNCPLCGHELPLRGMNCGFAPHELRHCCRMKEYGSRLAPAPLLCHFLPVCRPGNPAEKPLLSRPLFVFFY
jgi:hypothetical protein